MPADKDWEFVTKMTMVMRRHPDDGNPKLDELGWHEEALGRNAVAGGFQGQRQWTDWLPNARFYPRPSWLGTFDWNGTEEPYVLCNGERHAATACAMLLGTLVSNTAPCFA